jgi:hypothetical protein
VKARARATTRAPAAEPATRVAELEERVGEAEAESEEEEPEPGTGTGTGARGRRS